MTKGDAIENFKTKYFNEHLNKKLEKLNLFYQNNQQSLIKEFHSKISSMFQEMFVKQNGHTVNISNNRTGQHIFKCYDENFVEENHIERFNYDSTWIFNDFLSLYDESQKEIRKYVGKIHTNDLKALLLENVWKFNVFLERVIYQSFKEVENNEQFTDVFKDKKIMVYMENINLDTISNIKLIPIYVYDKTEKTHKDIKRILDGDKEISYSSYTGKDFIGLNCNDKLLMLTYFENCELNNLSSISTTLVNVDFKNCLMDNSDFSNTCLFSVNFKNCNLKNSIFDNAVGYKNSDIQPNFKPVCFYKANFENANLNHANFLNTNLKNANFKNAKLTKAVFSKEMKDSPIFSEEQKQSIIWV
jgi:hypothetical protein